MGEGNPLLPWQKWLFKGLFKIYIDKVNHQHIIPVPQILIQCQDSSLGVSGSTEQWIVRM